MFINRSPDLSRRAFLQRAAALSVIGAGAPLALNLAAAGEAAAFDATDYKALVCVYLSGGNDYANTITPCDPVNYALYAALRGGTGLDGGGIAYGLPELAATALTPVLPQILTDDLRYALAPSLPAMTQLFHAGKAAVLLNVGPLAAPTTLEQYRSSNRIANPLPPKLFSHNDQTAIWQSMAVEGKGNGWGGRLGDMALSGNGTSALTCISAAGNAIYVSGANALQYQISPSGAIPINAAKASVYGSANVAQALRGLITQSSSNIFETEFSRVTQRAIALESTVNDALSPVSLTTSFDRDGKANLLADQLKIVARLIGARETLGMKRQVFFVHLGGFDRHDDLMTVQPQLLGKVDEAMAAFYAATVELGVAANVTAFTASDFGRTLTSNGDGSDHGWGSHHFVVGGAVRGGQFFGTAPKVSITSDDQVGQGRLLPTTSVDQLAATLGKWFGVSESELPLILPNIGRFATPDLGILQ